MQGISLGEQRTRLKNGQWQRVERGIYLVGGEPPNDIEQALATLVLTKGVASHSLAGLLYDLDSVELSEPFVTLAKRPKRILPGLCIRQLSSDAMTQVRGYKCTTALQTILDLAWVLDDVTWEHVLENVLRNKGTTIGEIENALLHRRLRGASRIRRVLALRPQGALPTESLLETLMVQLIRATPALPEPMRQIEIFNKHGDFAGRPDLAWPDLGVFIELDGRGFHGQPIYDSRRETAIIAATGWLPARFTWKEVRYLQVQTQRRLVDIVAVATSRPPPSTFMS
jgi:very-short-patch-repair endonuclease